MRVLVQRVSHARVAVEGQLKGEITQGLTLLVGITDTDTIAEIEWMAKKCLSLRLFENEAGDRWAASVQDIGGDILVVSQFTLYGDCRKGRRPSFAQAASPNRAEPLFEQFVTELIKSGLNIITGTFGTAMMVDIHNDGPVTLWLERDAPHKS
ncbi:MAG: D-aminoacyl-tRNA deacylase [Leptolyngbyaceae cyanobacterium]